MLSSGKIPANGRIFRPVAGHVPRARFPASPPHGWPWAGLADAGRPAARQARQGAHRAFIASAMGSTYELADIGARDNSGAPAGQIVHHPPNLSPRSPVVPLAVAEALAAIDRAFHPIDGNQRREWEWKPPEAGGDV